MDSSMALNEVINFLNTKFGIPLHKIKAHTRLFHDLGIDGEDAKQLFLILEKDYKVDISLLHFEEFFGEEAGFNPVIYIYCLLFDRNALRKIPLLVSDLAEAIVQKKWFDSNYFENRRKIMSIEFFNSK